MSTSHSLGSIVQTLGASRPPSFVGWQIGEKDERGGFALHFAAFELGAAGLPFIRQHIATPSMVTREAATEAAGNIAQELEAASLPMLAKPVPITTMLELDGNLKTLIRAETGIPVPEAHPLRDFLSRAVRGVRHHGGAHKDTFIAMPYIPADVSHDDTPQAYEIISFGITHEWPGDERILQLRTESIPPQPVRAEQDVTARLVWLHNWATRHGIREGDIDSIDDPAQAYRAIADVTHRLNRNYNRLALETGGQARTQGILKEPEPRDMTNNTIER